MTQSAWQKDFQQASFRGQKFFILSADSDIGRRSVVYEFATRDTAYSVDLGKKTRRFSFQGLVTDSESRKALRDEFEKPGPGLLVHPWWGPLNVIIEGVVVRETTEEGNIARFDIRAVEVVNEAPTPTITPDDRLRIKSTVDKVFESAAADLPKKLGPVASASSRVRLAITKTVGAAATELRSIRGTIGNALGVLDDTASQITRLGDAASSIILTPKALASSITGLYASIFGAIAKVGTSFGTSARLLRTVMQSAGLFGADDPVVPRTTTQRIIEANAHDGFVMLVRTSVIAAAASIIPDIEYETSNDAQALSDAIGALVDDVEGQVDDDTYGYLQDLRAAVTAYLENAAIALPLLSQYTPIDTVPALCVAYTLYGDATFEADILARNNILNPAAVPGGVPLQVISNA